MLTSISLQLERQPAGRLRVNYEPDDEEDDGTLDVLGLQEVWDDFAVLVEALSALPGSDKYLEWRDFRESARAWAIKFRSVTFDEDVIPYIHCMYLLIFKIFKV